MLRLRLLVALIGALGCVTALGQSSSGEATKHHRATPAEAPKGTAAKRCAAKEKKKEVRIKARKLPPGAELRTGEAAIEQALQERVSLDVQDVPLGEVLDYLREACRVEIVLDSRTWQYVGIGGKSPVTKCFHRLPLRSVLALTLRDFDALTFTIHDDVLLITTREIADAMLVTRALDVSDLVVYRDEHNALWDNYDTLADAITSTISPESWDQLGGRGSIACASFGGAKVLVISQTWDVHRQITDELAAIRDREEESECPAAAIRQGRDVPRSGNGNNGTHVEPTPGPRCSRQDRRSHPRELTARGAAENATLAAIARPPSARHRRKASLLQRPIVSRSSESTLATRWPAHRRKGITPARQKDGAGGTLHHNFKMP